MMLSHAEVSVDKGMHDHDHDLDAPHNTLHTDQSPSHSTPDAVERSATKYAPFLNFSDDEKRNQQPLNFEPDGPNDSTLDLSPPISQDEDNKHKSVRDVKASVEGLPEMELSTPSMSNPRLQQIHRLAGNEVEENDSSLLGHKLKRRLMDIESSFIPDAGVTGGHHSAYSTGQGTASPKLLVGADDTFLFGGSPGRTANLAKTSPMTGIGADPRDSSVLLPSSPAAAAMQRGLVRGSGWRGALDLGAMAKFPPDFKEDEEK
jgi:hypothetical protein